MAHNRQASICLQHGRPGLGCGLPCSPGSTGYFGRLRCFFLVCFYRKCERAKKDQGIVAYKQLRAQDLGVKHGSASDTITNPFVGPHLLLPAPALITLDCKHFFPLLAFGHKLAETWATLNALWGVGRARAADGSRVRPKSTFKPRVE